MEVLKKLKIEFPYDLTIPLLGIYQEKTINQKDNVNPYVHSSTVHNNEDKETS